MLLNSKINTASKTVLFSCLNPRKSMRSTTGCLWPVNTERKWKRIQQRSVLFWPVVLIYVEPLGFSGYFDGRYLKHSWAIVAIETLPLTYAKLSVLSTKGWKAQFFISILRVCLLRETAMLAQILSIWADGKSNVPTGAACVETGSVLLGNQISNLSRGGRKLLKNGQLGRHCTSKFE